MEIKQVQKDEKKSKTITVRTFPTYSKWMKENSVSPTKVFNETLKELMQRK